MEHTKEIAKLVRVLRRTARMTMQAQWKGRAEEAVPFNIEQYNRILARLTDLASDTATLFVPLPADSSATVLALACRQLAAYFEDDIDWADMWCIDVPLPHFALKFDCC